MTASSRARAVGGLLWTLARTDFKTRYHGTLGGFFWALLKPLAMFAVLLAIFSFLFAGDPHYKYDLVIGLFLWDFFSEATKTGLASLHVKGFLVKRARFPRWILVAASSTNAVVTLGVFSALIVAALALFERLPTARDLALYGFYQLNFLTIAVGFSLASSVLFLRYRDLNQVWEVALQAGFFVAPVIWPLDILPERFHFVFYAWPPTPVIEFSRQVLLDGVAPSGAAHLLLAAVSGGSLAAGVILYRLLGPRAAEYL